jgi:hypothetical protein
MIASTLRGCVVLALICLALPRAEAVTIPFSGTVSLVETFYDPQGTLYRPPVPTVSVGTVITGTFTTPDIPGTGSYGVGAQGGNFVGSDSSPFISTQGGEITFSHETSGRTIFLTLKGQTGTFGFSDRIGFPFSWWRFSADVTTASAPSVPDAGSTALMLGLSLMALAAYGIRARRAF